MDVQNTKLELLESSLETDREDFWNELTDVEKEEIKDGIEELDQGKRIFYKDFLKRI